MKKNIIIITFILFFSVLPSVVNYFWIKNNISHIPPPWDAAAYIYMGLNDYDALRNDSLLHFIETFIKQDPYHAPLFPATGMSLFFILGPDINAAYLINAVYLFILIVSVFFLTERLAGVKAAMLSAFLIATFPAVIAFSRDYLSEFPLTALTALSCLFFIRSDSFKNKRDSILFGIFSGLSVLMKTLGLFFFVMPFFYAVYIFIKNKDSKVVRKNIIYSFLSAFIVAAIYYVPNFKQILGYFFHYGLGEGSKNYNLGISDILSLQYWTVYFKAIIQRGISPGYFFVFIISMLAYFFMRGKKYAKDYLLVWFWLICGYILLSSLQSKGGERYALPLLAPIAVIMSVYVMNISLKPLKYFLVAFSIVIGVMNYTYQTFSDRCHYPTYFLKGITILEPVHTNCIMQSAVFISYDKDWDVLQIMRAIEKLSDDLFQPISVLIALDHHFLNINTLSLYQKIDKLKGISQINFIFERLPNGPIPEDEVRKIMDRSHFIITKTGYQGPDFTNVNNSLVKSLLNKRLPVKKFIMSDESIVSVYRIEP